MTEQEQQRLISGLIKQRESWQPARQRAHKKPAAKRISQRDRELMECFRNRWQAEWTGWGRFSGQTPLSEEPPAPSNFYAR